MLLNGLPKNPRERVDRVRLEGDLERLAGDAAELTTANRRELGIYACGRMEGDDLVLRNGALRTSSKFDSHSFHFNPDAFPSIEASTCRGRDSLVGLLHTHPDGNSRPSRKDRQVSLDMNLVGCVVSRGDISCFFGDLDLPVVRGRGRCGEGL
jgi:proteasome lid subunit RPN8/RPN11